MIAKEQAINANEFHHGTCTKRVGPRGGERLTCERWRRNGRTKTWKTRPDEWRIPIKYGMRLCGYIYAMDAVMWHTAEDCVPVVVQAD